MVIDEVITFFILYIIEKRFLKNIKTYEEFAGYAFHEFLDSHIIEPKEFLLTLSCDEKHLKDLDGIGVYTKLERLACYDNKITSLEPLSDLINLILLNCKDNKLTSLKGIENLTELVSLYCDRNKITSLKPILNLTKLEQLYCWDNPIDWVDYVDKKGNIWYIVLPKSIRLLESDKFRSIYKYWEFMDKNQPVAVSRKFNF